MITEAKDSCNLGHNIASQLNVYLETANLLVRIGQSLPGGDAGGAESGEGGARQERVPEGAPGGGAGTEELRKGMDFVICMI